MVKKAILLLGHCDEHYVILRTILESSGYQVDLAENKRQAFNLVKDKKPALIIYCDKENQDIVDELKLFTNENITFWALTAQNTKQLLSSKEILDKVHNLIG